MSRNVLAWLEASAQRRPDAHAFEDESGCVSYQALHQRAREIGSFLLQSVSPQSPVLIFMNKSPACMAAMLGAVYAGCFYTPIDPSMPEVRMKLIASVLAPGCVLCEAKYMEKARSLCGTAHVFQMEDIPSRIDQAALTDVRQRAIDSDLLYVLFTSGSTGVPKGVSITHRAVIDFIEWACGALHFDERCRFGNQAPLYFDNSVLDIYGALCVGACVHFIPQRCFLFPARLLEYLDSQRIDTIFWVPSVLTAVANAGALDRRTPEGLARVYFCGEVMPCRTLNAWKRALPQARFVNMYGPTEITDVCTYFVVDRDFADTDTLPIGFPCLNTRVLLLDGEICVTGTCLSPGYYNAPERTKEAFIQNPLRPQITEMLYKTGDLGKYNDRGELLFLGRKDAQIKRHGYRIELGEVECVLCALEGVKTGCCLYDEGREQIVCFYTGTANEKDIRRQLKEALPKYMLPDAYVHAQALPETGNGKMDRVRIRREWEHEHPVL